MDKQKKFRLTTTLALLKQHGACASGYSTLLKSLGSAWPQDKPINLLRVLKSNGVQDMMWVMRATVEDSTLPRVAIAANMAQSVLGHYTKFAPTDTRVTECIAACRDFVKGKITATQLQTAWTAARAAWAAAAGAAAGAAEASWTAWTAARAAGVAEAAVAAAGAAAGAAARAAARAAEAAGAAERKKQAAIIRKWLR